MKAVYRPTRTFWSWLTPSICPHCATISSAQVALALRACHHMTDRAPEQVSPDIHILGICGPSMLDVPSFGMSTARRASATMMSVVVVHMLTASGCTRQSTALGTAWLLVMTILGTGYILSSDRRAVRMPDWDTYDIPSARSDLRRTPRIHIVIRAYMHLMFVHNLHFHTILW